MDSNGRSEEGSRLSFGRSGEASLPGREGSGLGEEDGEGSGPGRGVKE